MDNDFKTHTDFGVPLDFWERLYDILDYCTEYGEFSYIVPNLHFYEGYDRELVYTIDYTDLSFMTSQNIIVKCRYDEYMDEQFYKLTDRGRRLKLLKDWDALLRREKWERDAEYIKTIRDKFWYLVFVLGWLLGLLTYWIKEQFL